MYSSFIFLCIPLCLVQYVSSQSHGSPGLITTGMNLPYTPGHSNGLGSHQNGLQGPTGLIGSNNHGMVGQGHSMAMGNQGLGMGNQGLGMGALGGSGMALNGPGGPSLNNQMSYGKVPPAAHPGGYGGSGNGDVAVAGELPVAGMTTLNGQVPITGMVQFGGNVPAGGTVTISGLCSCGGQTGSNNVPPYGNMYGH